MTLLVRHGIYYIGGILDEGPKRIYLSRDGGGFNNCGHCRCLPYSQFSNSIEQTNAQAAKNNLLAIAAAQEKYYEDYTAYCTATTGNVGNCGNSRDNLNTNLHLSIFANDPFTYSCAVSGSYYTCTADDTVVQLTLTVTATRVSVNCSPDGSNPGSYCPAYSNSLV